MLPFEPAHRHGLEIHFAVRGLRGLCLVSLRKCGEDVGGICGLGEIVIGAQLDGLYRGGNAGIAGEHQNAHRGVGCAQRGYQAEGGVVAEIEVENGELESGFIQGLGGVFCARSMGDFIAPNPQKS